ncbi:MAG TPA: hypothetical protein VKE74_22360 [Gemmataceae bacterium]|nr:hypothetical protein [Gemmataceae bacterium]
MRARALLAAVVFVGGVGLVSGGADDSKKDDSKKPEAKPSDKADAKPDAKAFDRAELDKRLAKSAYDASDYGTKLYNDGKHADCYRVYQGALIALVPLLDHRPKLAAYVKDQLEKANGLDAKEGSFALRKALDAIYAETSESLFPPKKSLWDRLGGETGVKAVVHDFVAETLADKKLDLTRGGKYKIDSKTAEQLEEVLVDIVREWTGGPAKPTIPNLRAYLPGTKITEDEFEAILRHLHSALVKNKVPETEYKEVILMVRKAKDYIVNQ